MAEKFKFFVDEGHQFFHHHAEPILKELRQNERPFREVLIESLEAEMILTVSNRREKGKVQRRGIKANEVNEGLRRRMIEVFHDDILFEVKERQGFWEWGLKKEGFDFAIIDRVNNLMQLRNACFGERPLYHGEQVWETKIKDSVVFQSVLEMLGDAFTKDLLPGKDAPLPNPKKLPVLGEIQFGNHALRGVDMFRLMKAHRTSKIGLIVYIAPTGTLEGLLSSGIVTFNGMKEFLEMFDKEINVPVWLLGLDCQVIQ